MTSPSKLSSRRAIESLLGAEEPAQVLQGAELLLSFGPGFWMPFLPRLEGILLKVSRLEQARTLAGMTRWDIAAILRVDVQQVVRWECGAPISGLTAGDLACATKRRYPPSFFLLPPMGRIINCSLSIDEHRIELHCDAPGCQVEAEFLGKSLFGAETKAKRSGWRLDPKRWCSKRWCYCPTHRKHPSVGGPTAAQQRLFR